VTRRALAELKRGTKVADAFKAGVVTLVRPAAAGATRVDFADGTWLQGPSDLRINVLEAD
jgi:hypothetical protein